MEELSGSQILIETLRLEGVKTVFGYPGGAVLNIYDELYKQDYFEHVLMRHEQAAVHAADGYARASGGVGVAIVTSGPGFTNAVTGIATAHTDSIPLVIISGQVATGLIGTDAFQEIDAVGISRPCTKHNFLVKSVEELPIILKKAFYIARSGRPGPVHVDIPKDVTAAKTAFAYPKEIAMKTYKPTIKGNPRQIQKAVAAIREAAQPIFYIGGGAVLSGATEMIRKLVEFTGIPVVETMMARGTLPSGDPNLLGMVGMHGTYAANMGISEADLLVAMGARFDDRVTGRLSEFAKHAKIIHIDIDPSSIGKIVSADYPIVGDLKNVVEELIGQLNGNFDYTRLDTWRARLKNYDAIHPLSYSQDGEKIKPQWVIERVGEYFGANAVITTDVGQHQMWAAQFYPFDGANRWISSGGLGTMGYGFPAALGAKKARPDLPVINFTGDGSIMMNIQELMTASVNNIAVINIVLNNRYLGMVRQWQTFFYENRVSHTDLAAQPDFVKLADAFSLHGVRVTRRDEFLPALKAAVESGKTAILDVEIDREENVLPMVPTGGSLYNMILDYRG
ncbi:MAG: acetolactate synthase large subunit [Helicobacteraceae bacterium]|jgi:acetolactate synthase-1/2/3 large subunit|nr:acetolactate synthase large subunit [Helicobacteraceae bacterium]